MSTCEHDWVRAPDRDRSSTPLLGGGFVDMAFWCRKCLAVESRTLKFDARIKSLVEPELVA